MLRTSQTGEKTMVRFISKINSGENVSGIQSVNMDLVRLVALDEPSNTINIYFSGGGPDMSWNFETRDEMYEMFVLMTKYVPPIKAG